MRRAGVAIAVVTGALLAGCSVGGDPVTERRALPAFDRIAISGNVERLTLHAGPRTGAVVTAGEKVIDLVRTDVRDGRLKLTAKRRGIVIGPSGMNDVRVELTLPTLRGLEVSGGSATVTGIDADRLVVRVHGRGHLTASGRARTLRAEASTAAGADLFGLRAERVTALAHSAASLDVYASRTLDATARDAAGLTYRGPARVTEHVGTAADVSRDSND